MMKKYQMRWDPIELKYKPTRAVGDIFLRNFSNLSGGEPNPQGKVRDDAKTFKTWAGTWDPINLRWNHEGDKPNVADDDNIPCWVEVSQQDLKENE